jgi:hypothetical protein
MGIKLNQRLRRVVVAGALVLKALDAYSAPACAIAGPVGSRVSVAGSPLELPVVLPDRDGVRVLEGPVKACVRDARGRLNCRSFGAGAVLNERDLAGAAVDTGMLATFVDLLKGKSAHAVGVTRSGDTGLPQGTVLLLGGHLEVDFSQASLDGIEQVDFRDVVTGALVAKVRRGGARRVDGAVFRAGRVYRWSLASPVPLLARSGTFTIGERALLDRAREQQKFVAGTDTDSSARALMMAAWLDQHGLAYNASQALRRTGLTPE